jgi:hypothetical protein
MYVSGQTKTSNIYVVVGVSTTKSKNVLKPGNADIA